MCKDEKRVYLYVFDIDEYEAEISIKENIYTERYLSLYALLYDRVVLQSSAFFKRHDLRYVLKVFPDMLKIEFDVYDKNVLESQLLTRFDDGFSRNFIIRCDGKVVAAYSTYGECDKMCILSGLVVHPDYQRRGYGTQIMEFVHKTVASYGVIGVSLLRRSNVATIELYKKNGAKFVASQYKFIRK